MTAATRAGLAGSIGLLILRVIPGTLLLTGHGWSKVMRFPALLDSFADPIHLGSRLSLTLVVFAEVLCASLVIVGFLTRIAAIPIVLFLAVAGFIQHAHDPWAKREFAFIYGVPFLALAFLGGGRFSLDAALGTRWPWGGRRS